jgi:hypothetical protein
MVVSKMLELSSTHAEEKDHVHFCYCFVVVLLFLFSGFLWLLSHQGQFLLLSIYGNSAFAKVRQNLHLMLSPQKTYTLVWFLFFICLLQLIICPYTVLKRHVVPLSFLSLLSVLKAEGMLFYMFSTILYS